MASMDVVRLMDKIENLSNDDLEDLLGLVKDLAERREVTDRPVTY